MTAVTDTRKRSRDEDTCDFMPISKRINNLSITNQHHIFNSADSNDLPAAGLYNGNVMHHQQPTHQTAYYTEQMHNAIHYQANGHHQQHEHHHHHHHHQQQQQQQSSHISSNKGTNSAAAHQHQHQHSHQQQHQPDNLNAIDMENYSPELTAAENPFYYNKNKLLFDLHIERERRNQQTNH